MAFLSGDLPYTSLYDLPFDGSPRLTGPSSLLKVRSPLQTTPAALSSCASAQHLATTTKLATNETWAAESSCTLKILHFNVPGTMDKGFGLNKGLQKIGYHAYNHDTFRQKSYEDVFVCLFLRLVTPTYSEPIRTYYLEPYFEKKNGNVVPENDLVIS